MCVRMISGTNELEPIAENVEVYEELMSIYLLVSHEEDCR